MPRSRLVLAGTLVLVLMALAVPAVGLAGGSAGDQQYTDPFAGSSSSSSSTATTTTASPATTTASPVTPAPSTGSAEPTATAAADPASTGQPTATIAGGPRTSLPYTGYDAWTALGFGLTLVAGGAVLRRRLRTRGS